MRIRQVISLYFSIFQECKGARILKISVGVQLRSLTGAFSDCSGLTSIDIPDSVTSINKEVFYGCSGLTSIDIPNSVTSIGGWAFYGCSGLTSINIPNSVITIGDSAFSGCSGLTEITLPFLGETKDGTNNTYLGYVFGANEYASNGYTPKSLKKVTITGGSSIGEYAFSNCSGLTSIDIPNTVTSIGEYAFSDCRGLTSIDIPDSVTSIGRWAFSDCSGLTSINIPNSVTSIGDLAFARCTALKSVVIPDSVTSMGTMVFDYCESLTIYCEHKSQPSGWHANWKLGNRVIWGYNG